MEKMMIDPEMLQDVKALNEVMLEGRLTRIQEAAEKLKEKLGLPREGLVQQMGPEAENARYDCGQCVVCAACLGTPTPDIDIAAVTGVVLL